MFYRWKTYLLVSSIAVFSVSNIEARTDGPESVSSKIAYLSKVIRKRCSPLRYSVCRRKGGATRAANLIVKYSLLYKVDPFIVVSIISEESHFRPRAVSKKGAVGIMQLLPSTAREIAKQLKIRSFSRRMLFDLDVNIRMGVYYLKKLMRRFSHKPLLYLTAYNVGPTRLSRWLKRKKKFRQHYARRVLSIYWSLRGRSKTK